MNLISRLSSIDVIIAARILLLVNPPFQVIVKYLVNDSYPTLNSYAQWIYDQALEEGYSPN